MFFSHKSVEKIYVTWKHSEEQKQLETVELSLFSLHW